MTSIRLAVDAMGGDMGAEVVMQAVGDVLAAYPEVHVNCVGDVSSMREFIPDKAEQRRLQLVHADTVVSMEEPPLQALRRKRHSSSMGMALKMLRDGEVDACISAGNTGALTAMASYILKTLPGIQRPALCTAIPNINGMVLMLDLGANTEVSKQQMLQFAVMGAALATALYGDESPRVALLNIGTENHKGTYHLRDCDALLRESNMNYCGYAEANEIFTGSHRVIVCDGYSGNIALKSSEGAILLTRHLLSSVARESVRGKLAVILAAPFLQMLRHKLDPRQYNGASLLGLRGVVIKSHGHADRVAFMRAIEYGVSEFKKDLLQRIMAQLPASSKE